MSFDQLLSQPQPIITDGASGTLLASRGLSSGVPEVWNLTHPDMVSQVPADYAAAGAQIILTNTLGGSGIKLTKAGVDQHDEINRRAVELARQGVGDRALVFVSMGSTGELLGLTSTLTEADVQATFEAQAKTVVEAGADGFVIETMTDLGEAKCALRAVRAVCGLPVVVSLTYDEGARGPATMMGVRPEQAAVDLTQAGADMVGANCGNMSDEAWVRTIATLAANADRPIWAKPNAGLPQLVDGKPLFSMAPAEFVQLGRKLVDAGAKAIGGCCGTTPRHIAALAAELNQE